MSIRRIALLLCIALLACSCAGCLEHRNPDEYGYVTVIGIDRGEHKPFYITMLLQSGNTQAAENQAGELVGVECSDLFEAIALLESSLPFALTLSRTGAIVCSEDIARSGALADLLTVSLSALSIRYYANMIVARTNAKSYLEGLRNELAPNSAKLQTGYVEYSEKTGYVPSITLAEFYDRAWSGVSDVLLPLGDNADANAQQQTLPQAQQQAKPAEEDSVTAQAAQGEEQRIAAQAKYFGVGNYGPLPYEAILGASEVKDPSVDLLGSGTMLPGGFRHEGGLASTLLGSAVFRNTEMIGTLNATHTQVALMATGGYAQGSMQIPLPNGASVSVQLAASAAPDVLLQLGPQPHASVQIHMDAIPEKPEAVAGFSQAELTGYVSHHLEQLLENVFTACRAQGADIFGLGKYAVVQFTDTQQWEAFDWAATFAALDVRFHADVQIVRNTAGSHIE